MAEVDPADLPQAFADLGIGEQTLQTIARWGFTKPSPIQERAIPALLSGKDVVGVAQTGSGKTVAFGVPMVEALDPDLAEVQGIVLVPTRELASQVLDVLKDLAAGFDSDDARPGEFVAHLNAAADLSLEEVFAPVIADLSRLGLLERTSDRLRLTHRGLMLANDVCVRFL